MPEPHLRAADADRTAVASVLGEHMAAGRLTVAEYEERLGRAYAAKVYGELAELTRDLPGGALPAGPAGATAAGTGSRADRWHSDRSGADAGDRRRYAGTAAIVLAVWAVTSLASWELQYFWPMWVLGPWGVVLLVQAFAGHDGDEPRRRALPGR